MRIRDSLGTLQPTDFLGFPDFWEGRLLALKAAERLLSIARLTVVLLFVAKGARGQSAAFATIAGRVLDWKGASVS
jgi:hypothetical protein